MDVKDKGFTTKLIHAGQYKDVFGSATVPIYQTSTFAFESAEHGADCFSGKSDGYIYTRLGNPTIGALEKCVAELENGFGGIATGSGMGAVTSIYMSLLEKGAHMVGSSAVYGPSRSVIENHFSRFGVEATFVDTSDLENIKRSIKPNTKILYIESPANPTLNITDIAAASEIAHSHGMLVVVDNTFASPFQQRPLELGADVVLHSVTKFINGHADIVGGIIVAKTEELYKKIRPLMIAMGCNMDPHQAYMVIRGLKTLSLRMERAEQNSIKIAEFLENHPKVEWIKYPGLKSHPQHELAKKQMDGFGAMICFGVKGGLEAGKKLMDNLKLITLAVSLGGVESLIEHPASMTHAGVSPEEKKKANISDELVRLSVGIEDVDDLIADLKQAFDK